MPMATESKAAGHLAAMVLLAMVQLAMVQLAMGCPAMVTPTMAPQRAMGPPIVRPDLSTTVHF